MTARAQAGPCPSCPPRHGIRAWRIVAPRATLLRMKLSRIGLPACLVALLSACGPAPGYTDEPDTSMAPPSASTLPERGLADENPNCRMATPQTRLLGRMNGFRGVEGMNTLNCPLTPAIEPPSPNPR